jgi:hypothetical protein
MIPTQAAGTKPMMNPIVLKKQNENCEEAFFRFQKNHFFKKNQKKKEFPNLPLWVTNSFVHKVRKLAVHSVWRLVRTRKNSGRTQFDEA